MALKYAITVFYISLLALPFSYILNVVAFYWKDQRLLMLVGAFCLSFVAILPQIVLQKDKSQRINSFFNVMSLLTFSSILSLLTALENDGLIAEFLGHYLRFGVPFFKSAYGTMISYWDGIGHLAVYMMMMAALTWNQTFYDVGLYWVGSYAHRFVVLLVAVAMGTEGLGWVFLIQLPFVGICFWALVKFSREKTEEGLALQEELLKDDTRSKNCTSIWKRPLDFLLIIFYFSAGCFTLFKFIGTMGGKSEYAKYYSQKVEPYLIDPLPYSKAEVMVQTFYFIPYYGFSIFALLVPGQTCVPKYSLVFAGSIAQGQFAYMGSSFHYRTPYIYRVPQTVFARTLFWLSNGLLFIVPQIAAYLYNAEPEYFLIKPSVEKVDSNLGSSGKNLSDNNINKKSE